jgi:hypothetical protein
MAMGLAFINKNKLNSPTPQFYQHKNAAQQTFNTSTLKKKGKGFYFKKRSQTC